MIGLSRMVIGEELIWARWLIDTGEGKIEWSKGVHKSIVYFNGLLDRLLFFNHLWNIHMYVMVCWWVVLWLIGSLLVVGLFELTKFGGLFNSAWWCCSKTHHLDELGDYWWNLMLNNCSILMRRSEIDSLCRSSGLEGLYVGLVVPNTHYSQ